MEKSLTGRVVVVTGANQGLGFATSEALAKRGATVYMLCRNQERGEAARKALLDSTGNADIHLEVVDMSSQASIKAFAERYNATGKPVHCLIQNAGAIIEPKGTTPEGYDGSFAVNSLGPLALTLALKPALVKGAPSTVVFVSSGGQYAAELSDDFDFKRLGRSWNGTLAYGYDKRRQTALAEVLSRRWTQQGIHVCSMHPGWAETEGVKTSIPGFYNSFKAKLRTQEQGADTVVWLASLDPAQIEGGAFYLDRQSQPKHLSWSGTSYKDERAEEVAAKMAALTGYSLD